MYPAPANLHLEQRQHLEDHPLDNAQVSIGEPCTHTRRVFVFFLLLLPLLLPPLLPLLHRSLLGGAGRIGTAYFVLRKIGPSIGSGPLPVMPPRERTFATTISFLNDLQVDRRLN